MTFSGPVIVALLAGMALGAAIMRAIIFSKRIKP